MEAVIRRTWLRRCLKIACVGRMILSVTNLIVGEEGALLRCAGSLILLLSWRYMAVPGESGTPPGAHRRAAGLLLAGQAVDRLGPILLHWAGTGEIMLPADLELLLASAVLLAAECSPAARRCTLLAWGWRGVAAYAAVCAVLWRISLIRHIVLGGPGPWSIAVLMLFFIAAIYFFSSVVPIAMVYTAARDAACGAGKRKAKE